MPIDSSASADPTTTALGVIAGVIGYLVLAYLLSRILKKADVPGWIAFVPIYNHWTLFRLGGFAGWWALIALIPFLNIVAVIVMFIAQYRIGRSLQKSGLFVLWAIFLPPVYFAWLAFDRSTWRPYPGETHIAGGASNVVTA